MMRSQTVACTKCNLLMSVAIVILIVLLIVKQPFYMQASQLTAAKLGPQQQQQLQQLQQLQQTQLLLQQQQQQPQAKPPPQPQPTPKLRPGEKLKESVKFSKYLHPDEMTNFRLAVASDLSGVDLDSLKDSDLSRTVHSVFDNVNVVCKRKLRMGELDDGGWEICDDPDVRPLTPCIVYSFGIGGDWSFDDVISRVYGCHVYAFDPSIGLETHNRSSLIHFYKIGISSYNHVNSKGWKMMSFTSIREMLGHKNKRVDVVKMDVEGSEWDILHDVVNTGVLMGIPQLLFEYHIHSTSRAFLLPKLKDVQTFEKAGFKKFCAHKNFHCPTWVKDFPIQRTLCYEVHYIYRPS